MDNIGVQIVKKLELVNENSDLKIYRFRPSILNLFHGNLRIMNLHEIIRFISLFVHGYEVYHLYIGNKEIGYCVVQKGGSYRYKFATPKDIIIGPYFIANEFRKQGYATYLLNKILYEFDISYENIYCFIHKNNIASKKTVGKLGFKGYWGGKHSRITRILKKCDYEVGDFIIYKFNNNELVNIL